MMLATEKRGGRGQPLSLLQGFSETVFDCGLQDLGFVGEKYTWEKSRGKDNWVHERLDRGLANQEWCQLFPSAEVRVLEVATSDHLPLFLQLNKQVYQQKGKRFRFENTWLREKDCLRIVKDGWEEMGELEIVEKIHFVGLSYRSGEEELVRSIRNKVWSFERGYGGYGHEETLKGFSSTMK